MLAILFTLAQLVMKYSQLLRLLHQAGWYVVSQNGSHIKMKHPDRTDFIIVLNHGSKEIGKVLERKTRKQAGLQKASIM